MRTTRLAMTTVLAAGLLGVAAPALAAGGNNLNCSDFDFQEDAQAVLERDPSDPNRLDEGGVVGLACESLPRRGSAAPTAETGVDTTTDQMAMPAGGAETGAGGTAGGVTGLLATGGLLAAAGAGGLVLVRRRSQA
ncbi:hypothetical protein WDZ17_10395 [Pseudokineococcus basanitobsidens]|uniref:Gram-positive cocci surface proteins LPxTG domain-containing protein n=1 Tax=Pseudokineococcus basanitobsidens TaxID=1926649 RepID=A0ABU8RKT4_9ACTN